jgi:hypothetical protein
MNQKAKTGSAKFKKVVTEDVAMDGIITSDAERDE